jgi:site-specific DNA-cytosine methylase
MGFSNDFKTSLLIQTIYAIGNSIAVPVLNITGRILRKRYYQMKLNIATVFSGIGSFEYAKRLDIEHNIVFACDNGEIDDGLEDEEVVRFGSK